MVYYAVIDTNVLVSALLAKHEDAATLQVIQHMLRGDIIPLYDTEILSEYAEVLHRPKFRFPAESVRVLLEAIVQYGEMVDRFTADAVLPDPKDRAFYEVALTKQDQDALLVTGNIKHFPRVPFVVTPNEMLEIMKQRELQAEQALIGELKKGRESGEENGWISSEDVRGHFEARRHE